VIEKDRRESILILRLEQRLNRPGGQFRKCSISRRKHRIRAGLLECIHQTGRLNSGDERVERTGSNGRVHYVVGGLL
jgi:hypothetical protein